MKKYVFLLLIILLFSGCVSDNPTGEKECNTDEDCVPATCCHSALCVNIKQKPDCSDIACTMECKPGTLDCGGKCICYNRECIASYS